MISDIKHVLELTVDFSVILVLIGLINSFERNTVEEDEMVWACGKHGEQTHDAYGGTLKERDWRT